MTFAKRLFSALDRREMLHWMPDEMYLHLLYQFHMGQKLHLSAPETFNEKLQWLKLYDRKPEYSLMVDKYEAKQYVANRIGGQFVIPTYGVWNSFEEIDFALLPDQFVLKCTHDSGGLVICRDKSKLDLVSAKEKIEKSLKRNYYWQGREWPYKAVRPRILAEKYMEDKGSKETGLIDYKFFCMNGKVAFLYISKGLENHATASISFVSPEWKFLPFKRNDYKPFDRLPEKPKNLSMMIEIAEELSKDITFLRVDLYEINGCVYFSELTFSPCSGMIPFEPISADRTVGEMLLLPDKKLV